jgi:hypothetical protein
MVRSPREFLYALHGVVSESLFGTDSFEQAQLVARYLLQDRKHVCFFAVLLLAEVLLLRLL